MRLTNIKEMEECCRFAMVVCFYAVHQCVCVLDASAASSASPHSRLRESPSCMDIYRTQHVTGKLWGEGGRDRWGESESPKRETLRAWGEQVMRSVTPEQVAEDEWWAASEARGQSPAQSRRRRRVVSQGRQLWALSFARASVKWGLHPPVHLTH